MPPAPPAAFLGEPTNIQLTVGKQLYRFTLACRSDRTRLLQSPSWIRQPFDDLRMRARRLQKPLLDSIRSQMAIPAEWNPGMDTLFTIALAAPAAGGEGRARWQPVTMRGRDVLFTGGGSQLAVPGSPGSRSGFSAPAGRRRTSDGQGPGRPDGHKARGPLDRNTKWNSIDSG